MQLQSFTSEEIDYHDNMGLRITDISLSGFRNYDDFSLGDIGNLTIFTGHNGVGKTNVLEAIQLMTSASSFRHPHIAQLVKDGTDHARIQMESTDGNRRITTALTLETGKKRYTVNGKAKSVVDIRGTLPAVAFTPDDLQLAKKSSSVKRNALDDLGAQLTRNYHVVLGDYEKTLRYKNRLLKEEAPSDLVAAINETLITCGSQLFCYRVALYSRMLPLLQRTYSEISHDNELFSATYLASWDHADGMEPVSFGASGLLMGEPFDVRDNGAPDRDQVRTILAAKLEAHAPEERRRARSLVGPHNDKIAFFLSGRDASAFASQGQQRSIVLAWKLAEVELVRQTLGTNPVLLLDDVMSELDATRRDTLVHFASEDLQTFITATDLDAFNPVLLDRARIVAL
ncbi:MAG: DNA replication and repair protein RecF [Eggerthellaceae bacterium]|nr:DNA replication and repair protein RecF [Eggerthellaceae bacterium]